MSVINQYLPSKDNFLTTGYIDQIIESGLWVEHGDGLEMFVSDFSDGVNLPEKFADIDIDVVLKSRELRVFLERWLPLRFDYVVNCLNKEIASEEIEVSRAMFVDDEWKESLLDGGHRDYGRFWGTGRVESWGAGDLKEGETAVIIKGLCNLEQVDWNQTLRSRMDYTNGDDEQEIYIREGVAPKITSVWCNSEKRCLLGGIATVKIDRLSFR